MGRWRDGNGEFNPPGMFAPRAEETSLIHPLTEWVMRRVFSRRDLPDGPWGEIPVSINVSPRNLES
ncbi:MAG: EAL domain-containing protein [Alkalispirochaeta sp.]